MLSRILNNLNISTKLKKEITRYVISFFFAWLISALISDFPFYKNAIIQIKIADFLTFATIHSSQFLLELFQLKTQLIGNHLKIEGTPGVLLVYGCLGLRHFAFLIVFVLLQTGKLINKLWYIPLGVLILFLLNSFRIALIAYWQTHNMYESQLIHDVASPFILYPAILFLWIFWLDKFGKTTKTIGK